MDQLVARGVRNFVFSTHWSNEVPLQTATTSQQGWSRWFGANLIASNIADKREHAGSGIYAAGDAKAVSFDADASAWPMADALLIADLNAGPPFPPVVPSVLAGRWSQLTEKEKQKVKFTRLTQNSQVDPAV